MGLTKKKSDSTGTDLSGDAIGTLGTTVGSFENRLSKRLAEQEKKYTQAEQAAQLRNDRMLQALHTIRRALQETQKIKLGDRFQLVLDVNDWNGWPRIELNLQDSLDIDNCEFGLIVTAHDRKQSGTVEFRTRNGEYLGGVSLVVDKEMAKIPVILKRAVRSYLDIIAEYVLNPKSAEQLMSARIELKEEEVVDIEAQKLKSVDVFEEDSVTYQQNQVQLEPESENSIDISFEKTTT